jgi:hypothetical protein
MRIIIINWVCGLASVMLCSLAHTADHKDKLQNTIDLQIKTELTAKKSQKKIDGLADQADQMLAEYRNLLRQAESLRIYNNQLDKLVLSQQGEIDSIAEQLINMETTQREIVPLILKMVEVISQFVALDIPFLPEERQFRVAELQTIMERADVSLAEKYRRVLEAYQVETEYGRTIEAYQDELERDERIRTVNFLRSGRVGLYYLTLDGQQAGVWDAGWRPLDSEYRQAIDKGLKVANKQLPPDLLVLPIKTEGTLE